LCGDSPSITELIDYEDFCGVKPPETMTEITVSELKQKLTSGLDGILIDVRMPDEHSKCSIPGSQLIPLPEIESAVADLPKDKPLYIHCKGGVRSARACTYLAKVGYTQLVNIKGGMDAWLEMDSI
jgi:adenylyltransferase/sulfurtransferase